MRGETGASHLLLVNFLPFISETLDASVFDTVVVFARSNLLDAATELVQVVVWWILKRIVVREGIVPQTIASFEVSQTVAVSVVDIDLAPGLLHVTLHAVVSIVLRVEVTSRMARAVAVALVICKGTRTFF